jgi:FtsH-binding integral membrane protein
MNIKSILLSTITGTIVYFALGWLFYGILFTDLYPEPNSMLFIVLGSLFYVFEFALIYGRWASISTFKGGAKAGLILGILYALSMNFFMSSSSGHLDIESFVTGLVIAAVSTAIMGGVVGFTIGKTS